MKFFFERVNISYPVFVTPTVCSNCADNDLSDVIISKLDNPIKNSLEILEVSKLISEQLEIYHQICLINFIQIIWWRKTKKVDIVKKLENLKFLIRKRIQPRMSWEVTLLKISMEDI